MTTGYCVKCREKREMQNVEPIVMKNGRHAEKGTCSTCSCKVFKIVKKLE